MSRKGIRESSKPPYTMPATPAISAVLLECPRPRKRGPPRPDCERQMMVHIRVSPTYQIESLDKFLLLDEVYDQKRQAKAKLMSPYLIEISRGEPVIMYPLEFSKSIRCDTCGHKNATSNTATTCDMEIPLVPVKTAPVHLVHNDVMNQVISTNPLVSPAQPTGVHSPRCAAEDKLKKEQQQQQQQQQQEQQQQQQQQQHNQNNEASVERSHSPDPKPSENIESQQQKQKLASGIMDESAHVKPKSTTNVEECFPSSDLLSHDVDDNGAVYGMEYDADDYDERNLNYDTLTGGAAAGAEAGEGLGARDFPNTFRNKRLKTESADSESSEPLNLPDALSENEKLFREAERKSEEARLDTINAFKMKHPHLVGTVIGTSAIAGGGGSVVGYGPGSLGNAGKPHVAGIQEDCIRPQGEFDADAGDIDADAVGTKTSSTGGEQRQTLGLTLSPLHSEYGHQLDDMETQKMSRPHYGSLQRSQSKWPDVQFRGSSLRALQSNIRSQDDYISQFSSNPNRENAFPSTKLELPYPSQSKGLPLWRVPQQRHQSNYEYSNDDSARRAFPFSEDIGTKAEATASGTTSGSSANGDDSVAGDTSDGDEDSDKSDASARSLIESKTNNIAKIDDIGTGTAAGGMGDEFYWNTLNYPKGHETFSNDRNAFGRNPFNTYKIDVLNTDKYHEISDHNTPKRLSNCNKDHSCDLKAGHNDNDKKLKKIMSKLRPPFRGSAGATANAQIQKNNRLAGHFGQRGLIKKKLQQAPSYTRTRLGAKTNENFSDKSVAALARMKVRSSDAALGAFGEDSGSSVGKIRSTHHGSVYTGPVDTYSSSGGVVPAFPLNNYPGYSGLKTFGQYITPPVHESHYKVLEKISPEYLPKQPLFAKEIGDPNLTVNDKINLLEVLSARDDTNDPIFQKLENDLDNSVIIHDHSNHDRMSFPARSLYKKGKKAKRSYVMYDDLSMRDTYDQYDDSDIERVGEGPISIDDSAASADVSGSSCKTCQGKKCHVKSVDDSDCACDREGRHCKCTAQNMNKPGKKIRSVSDAWYSVFNTNAPLQFLTTRVGIYRKRHGAWWRIAPSITLTSLSGIYANGNLSILFSSHVDIFQLKRPLTLENHKLLVPRSASTVSALQPDAFESIDPYDILAIDGNKFDFSAIHDDTGTGDDNDNDQTDETRAKGTLCQAALNAEENGRKRRSHSSSDEVLSVGDLGTFPSNMTVLEQCPHNQKHLCLNLLDEEVPSFTVKIKQPFRENGLIFQGDYSVRIASVICDATTRGALQVAVVLVNEGYVSHEFAVCISNCPMTFGAKTTVKKDLAPHLGETISFLLPLEENKDKKIHCKLEVKSPDQKVISKRKFTVEPTARCLCIWDCDCHCVPDLVSHDDYNVCHKLDKRAEYAAGFIQGEGDLDQGLAGWQWFLWRMNEYAFNLLLCMLLLGFLKAILGAIGLRRIDRMGYNYVQPLQKYEYASRCRRFFINIVFFVVLPFIFCCKCFTPTEEDLLIASTEWQCSVLQQDLSEDSSGDGGAGDGAGTGGGGGWSCWGRNSHKGGGHPSDDDDDDEETILSQRFESGDVSLCAGCDVDQSKFNEYLMNSRDYDEEEEERDTNYVLQALTESRESIRKLLKSHCSEDLDPNNPRRLEAEDLVSRLVAAKIVHRTFDRPKRNVDVPPGQKYSIRGYFVPSVGPGYQYFTPSPLAQLRRITANTTALLLPPVILQAEEFTRIYASKCEVLEADDLTVEAPLNAPCINCSNGSNENQLSIATAPEGTSVSNELIPSAAPDDVGATLTEERSVLRFSRMSDLPPYRQSDESKRRSSSERR